MIEPWRASPATNSPGWLDSSGSGSRASGHHSVWLSLVEIGAGHQVARLVAAQPALDAGGKWLSADQHVHRVGVQLPPLSIAVDDGDVFKPALAGGGDDACAREHRDVRVGGHTVDEVARHAGSSSESARMIIVTERAYSARCSAAWPAEFAPPTSTTSWSRWPGAFAGAEP